MVCRLSNLYDIATFRTVDGGNPAPVEVGSLSHFFPVLYIPGGCLGFLPSTVGNP